MLRGIAPYADVMRASVASAGAGHAVNLVLNARLQLLATAMNNIAVALVVTGFVVPIINGQLWDVAKIVITLSWICFGISLHLIAQLVLGKLRP
jgi:hypothetical protein